MKYLILLFLFSFGCAVNPCDSIESHTVFIINKDSKIAVTGSGYGFCDTSGNSYILTAKHILHGRKSLIATSTSNFNGLIILNENYSCSLISEAKDFDLCLLSIDEKYLFSKLNLTEGNEKIGDELYVCGNPYGILTGTISKGILSRYAITRTGILGQTDAGIYIGDSGGGVFNKKGELARIAVSVFAQDGKETVPLFNKFL